MHGDLYETRRGEDFHSRDSRYVGVSDARCRSKVPLAVISRRNGLIHRAPFVGNYVKATLPYFGKSTAAR